MMFSYGVDTAHYPQVSYITGYPTFSSLGMESMFLISSELIQVSKFRNLKVYWWMITLYWIIHIVQFSIDVPSLYIFTP